jgi:adenylate kinase family enzyme
MRAERIAIIGIGGTGKSVLSRELAQKTGLPVFHADQLWWRKNWEEVPEEEYLPTHAAWVSQEKWIIEGYVDPAMAERLRRADLIIYLDYPGARAAWRAIRRWWKHRKESRPELPPEAVERFSPDFYWRVFTRKERVVIERALAGIDVSKVVRLHTPQELARFLERYT